MIKKNLIITFIIMLSLFWNCSKKAVIDRYYILDYTVAAELKQNTSESCSQTQFSVRIEPFKISQSFSRNRIALRTKSNEILFYHSHNWAEKPASAVRYFVWEQIKKKNIFKECVLIIHSRIPEYVIRGTISSLERVENKDKHGAHIKAVLELLELESGKTIVLHHFDRSADISPKAGMNVFAQKISFLLDDENKQFAAKICKALK